MSIIKLLIMKYKIGKLFLTIIISIIISSCKIRSNQFESPDLLIKSVNVIPMTSEIIWKEIDVYIKNGIIKEIGNLDNFEIPDNTIYINGSGKFLTPGFSDMHVQIQNKEYLSLFLANGVTLIRNMWGYPEHIDGREKIKSGKLLGPELFTAGPVIDGRNSYWPGCHIITDPDRVELSIRHIKESGYDFIKIYDLLSPEIYKKIMKVAKKYNIPVVGHIPLSIDFNDAVNSRMHSIEHFAGYKLSVRRLEDLSNEIDLTIESGIWNCPALVSLKKSESLMLKYIEPDLFTIDNNPEMKYISPEDIYWWKKENGRIVSYEKSKKLLRILNEGGANIVSGTNQGMPFIFPGFSLHDELQLMTESGLTPYQALLTTTLNPAKLLGIEDRLGTVEKGKEADLVLLEKNPLENIGNTRTIYGVITKGRWLSGNEIKDMLKKVEKSYE